MANKCSEKCVEDMSLVELESCIDNLLTVDLSYLQELFVTDYDAQPMEFCLNPSSDTDISNVLKKLLCLVEKCGGIITFNRDAGGLHSIKMVFKGETVIDRRKEDIFKFTFLIDSVRGEKILNLNDYRMNRLCYKTVDVMDILNKRKSWEDVKYIGDDEVSDTGMDNDGDEGHSDAVLTTPSKVKTLRTQYSHEEDLQILNYIIDKNYFSRVKSKAMWVQMEKVIQSRSWQSMKERFRHSIFPKLATYNLSELHKAQFVNGFRFPRSGRASEYKCDSNTELTKKTSGSSSAKTDAVVEHTEVAADNNGLSNRFQDKRISSDLDSASSHVSDVEIIENNFAESNKTSDSGVENGVTVVSEKKNEIREERCSSSHSDLAGIHYVKENEPENGASQSSMNNSDGEAIACSLELDMVDERIDEDYIRKCYAKGDNLKNTSHAQVTANSQSEHTFDRNIDGANTVELMQYEIESSSNSTENCEMTLPEEEDKMEGIEESSLQVMEDIEFHLQQMGEGDVNMQQIDEAELDTRMENTAVTSTPVKDLIETDESEKKLHSAPPVKSNETQSDYDSPIKEHHNDDTESKRHVDNEISTFVEDGNDYEPVAGSSTDTTVLFDAKKYNNSEVKKSGNETQQKEDREQESLLDSTVESVVIETSGDTSDAIEASEETSDIEPGPSCQNSRMRKNDLKSASESNRYAQYHLTFHEKFGSKRKLIESKSREDKFSVQEDREIIYYIYKYNEISSIRGRRLWVEMQDRDICKGRTWLSMKDRFNKRILPNINVYKKEGVSENIINRLLEEDCSNIINYKEKVVSPQQQKGDYFARLYTDEEKKNIVQFIVENRRYREIKGNKLYQTMAKKMDNPNKRTWQSLQNTFKKYILPNIQNYVKSKDVIKAFREASAVNSRRKTTDIVNSRKPSLFWKDRNKEKPSTSQRISEDSDATESDSDISAHESMLSQHSDDSEPYDEESAVVGSSTHLQSKSAGGGTLNKKNKFASRRMLLFRDDRVFAATPAVRGISSKKIISSTADELDQCSTSAVHISTQSFHPSFVSSTTKVTRSRNMNKRAYKTRVKVSPNSTDHGSLKDKTKSVSEDQMKESSSPTSTSTRTRGNDRTPRPTVIDKDLLVHKSQSPQVKAIAKYLGLGYHEPALGIVPSTEEFNSSLDQQRNKTAVRHHTPAETSRPTVHSSSSTESRKAGDCFDTPVASDVEIRIPRVESTAAYKVHVKSHPDKSDIEDKTDRHPETVSNSEKQSDKSPSLGSTENFTQSVKLQHNLRNSQHEKPSSKCLSPKKQSSGTRKSERQQKDSTSTALTSKLRIKRLKKKLVLKS